MANAPNSLFLTPSRSFHSNPMPMMNKMKSENGDVEAGIHYLSRDPIYDTIKPYTMRYQPSDDLPMSNITRKMENTKVYNMRHCLETLRYETCGFQLVTMESQMTYEDFWDFKKIDQIHRPEIERCVKATMKASDVRLLDYGIRRRHPKFPIATGQPYEWQQPASRAHIDFTYDSGVGTIRSIFNNTADSILESKWQYINVWHPLKGPLVDWPLSLCDAGTVDCNDIVPGDVVDRTRVIENSQIHFNPQQKWYYLKDQLPSELLLFKNADSESADGASSGVPHASFQNPLAHADDFCRESIEFRLLVLW